MNVLIVGGTGLIGTHLAQALLQEGQRVWVLSRRPERAQIPPGVQALGWDGQSTAGWGERLSEMQAVVSLAGATIGSWPWTQQRKKMILSSRVTAGQVIASAMASANPRPQVLVQASGVGYYGPLGDQPVTEDSSAGNDYLAEVAQQCEASSKSVEGLGVRRIIIRSAIVLAAHAGVLPLMALPVRFYAGGPLGNGRQGVSWIHIEDEVNAIRFLIGHDEAVGAYNLAAPTPVSNADFMRSISATLKRPFWLPAPAFALRLGLGEMSTLLLDGQFTLPKRLTDLGYTFKFPELQMALRDLYH